ncbi:MAG: Fic family protein [Synergistaceae bacterium]|nr:Fic family protein [Synergistaceae bacterium]
MDLKYLSLMLSDPHVDDLKKMQYKYYPEALKDMLDFLYSSSLAKELPLRDFSERPIVLRDCVSKIAPAAYKRLMTTSPTLAPIDEAPFEEEIYSTLQIENISSSRESIRNILGGAAPRDNDERRLLGLKLGLEFISDPSNDISEENIYRLYNKSIADELSDSNRLLPGGKYRHDAVFVVGGKVEHRGMMHEALPNAMKGLVAYANEDTGENDLIKAAVLHFYLSYIHPYFDGNGRMARLLNIWHLVQRGYPAALLVSISSQINKTRSDYYKAFNLIEKNAAVSSRIDITPFVAYIVENVYNKAAWLPTATVGNSEIFKRAVGAGKITLKERELFEFVMATYGNSEFSTKELERDFGNAAYATVRAFVMKFEEFGFLRATVYTNKKRYFVA